MDDLIDNFFKNYFTEELRLQLFRSLGLFAVFGFDFPHEELPDIITRLENEHREVLVDRVFKCVGDGVNTLFDLQRIKVLDSAPLRFKNDLLEAIYAFSYREDYRPYQLVVENWTLTNEEKLASIMSDVLDIEETLILENVEWVYDGTMDKIVDFIKSKNLEMTEVADVDSIKNMRKNLFAFHEAFGKKDFIEEYSTLDLTLNEPFKLYLDFFKEEIIDLADMEKTTFSILWFGLISKENSDNLLKYLLSIANDLFSDLNQMQIFSKMIEKAFGRYQDFRKHQK